MQKSIVLALALCAAAAPLLAQEAEPAADAEKPTEPVVIQLPAPDKTGGKPLMQALDARKSTRAFSEKEISMETLSSLLWAGFGVNRDDGRRTAPTARNTQDITIYLLTAKGAFMYDAKANTLVTISKDDARDAAAPQAWAKKAPLMLYFVQPTAGNELFGAMHAGSIYQNISLFNASEGLGDVVVGTMNRDAVAKALGLNETQRIVVGQIVGWPQ